MAFSFFYLEKKAHLTTVSDVVFQYNLAPRITFYTWRPHKTSFEVHEQVVHSMHQLKEEEKKLKNSMMEELRKLQEM